MFEKTCLQFKGKVGVTTFNKQLANNFNVIKMIKKIIYLGMKNPLLDEHERLKKFIIHQGGEEKMVDVDLLRGFIEQVDMSCNLNESKWD